MKDFRDLLQDNEVFDVECRQFNRLGIGKYELSIQASARSMCTPRESLEDLKEYISMEVVLFDKNNNILVIENNNDFTNWNLKEVFNDCLDDNVYTDVPVEVIQDLFEYLIGLNNNQDNIEIINICEGKVDIEAIKRRRKRLSDSIEQMHAFD